MIEQLKTIRAGLETATCYTLLGVDAHAVQTALTALAQLEAMVGKQEPVHWRAVLDPEQVPQQLKNTMHVVGFREKKAAEGFVAEQIDFYGWRYTIEPLYAAPVAKQYEAGDMASAAAQGFRDGVASVTQQPQANEMVCREIERGGDYIKYAVTIPNAKQPHDHVAVTWDAARTRILAVTRQDEEGRILSVIAEAPAQQPDTITPAELAKRIERGEKWEVAQQPQAEAVPCPTCVSLARAVMLDQRGEA